MNSHEVFIHIHQGCFAGTGAIVRLPQCQWSKPDGYGKISQCITTTKHSKAKTACIFLGIYCIRHICIFTLKLKTGCAELERWKLLLDTFHVAKIRIVSELTYEDMGARIRYQGQGQVIKSYRYCGTGLLPDPQTWVFSPSFKASDPGKYHGTCVTHVPWCMSGSLTCGGGENVPGIPGECATPIVRIWKEAHVGFSLPFIHASYALGRFDYIPRVLHFFSIGCDFTLHASSWLHELWDVQYWWCCATPHFIRLVFGTNIQ